MIITQSSIIEGIINEVLGKPDLEIMSACSGAHLVAVRNESNAGLCSRPPGPSSDRGSVPGSPDTVHGLVNNLFHQNTINASWGLAAVNSLLNQGIQGIEIKVQEFILSLGKSRNVAIIGHFPFVDKMSDNFKNFWVLELSPREKDFPEKMKTWILPRADLVAITATSLLNNTLGEILNLSRKDAIKILLGPSTPMAACLLNMGLDYLGGTLVNDHEKAFTGIQKGLPFRKLDGISYIVAGEEHFSG